MCVNIKVYECKTSKGEVPINRITGSNPKIFLKEKKNSIDTDFL